jgi:hypothetical protein
VNKLFRFVTIVVLVLASTIGFIFPAQSFATDQNQAVVQADRALLQALANADNKALEESLDAGFTWIEANGKSHTKAEILANPPQPSNAEVEPQQRTYGEAAVVRANRERMQVLRVWARRATGWKLVLYQEVKLVEKSEPAAADGAGITECENPCNSIPIHPETHSEEEAVASWQGVMRAMANKDPDAYAPLIADEFAATDTHHDRAYTKADRIAQLTKQKQTGAKSVPPPLVSARLFDFSETVMMIAREQRPNSKAYFNTRMWVKREGRWQMLFSFNTRIE